MFVFNIRNYYTLWKGIWHACTPICLTLYEEGMSFRGMCLSPWVIITFPFKTLTGCNRLGQAELRNDYTTYVQNAVTLNSYADCISLPG